MHTFRVIASAAILLSVAFALGCATPVGVRQVDEGKVYKQISASALTTGSYSGYTAVVMHRYDLKKGDFSDDPLEFIRKLHGIACRDNRRDVLLALSELCFLAGRNENDRLFYASSAVYAYLFILGPGEGQRKRKRDRRNNPLFC